MNIHKTNKIGVMLAKSGFIGGNKMINKIKNTPPWIRQVHLHLIRIF